MEETAGATLARPWTIDDSNELYHLQGWGEPYFSVNEQGNIEVTPLGTRGGAIDLYGLVQALQQRGLSLPLLIRFSNILEDRIDRLNQCFIRAIEEYGYDGDYRGVFPVKVNQQRYVVEEVVRYGAKYKYGLEAGSKPELMIVLATLKTPGALVICNGYKDREYIETALLAQRLGQTPIVVIEQLSELDTIITASRKLGIKPLVGVRAKLLSKGVGRWGTSTGERAKFGLSAAEIIEVVERLRQEELLDSLQLLHFHVGSQISNISVFKNAMREASQIYVELAKLGANMRYLDVGGGLGIDYDGSKTDFPASKNYNMQDYAYDIVSAVQEACSQHGIPVPTLISESGRAIVSHQAVLVFDVLGAHEVSVGEVVTPTDAAHQVIRSLHETWESIDPRNLQSAYHDAAQYKDEALSLFQLGYLTLEERAWAEQLYWKCCHRILELGRKLDFVPEELGELEQTMASIYYCNFSVFQSAPDSWAIDQLFPVLPIHRLNEEPTKRGTLADLTCDSDGKIDQFIDIRDVKHALELHPYKPGEPYYLGLFLIGAYQEILGDLHNLFGDTNAVHVHLTDTPEGYHLEHVVRGDSISEALRYVEYRPEGMVESIRRETEKALRERRITIEESRLLLHHYERSLSGYTYLWD
ncbi:Biosynthetic arginine decarboxylase [compost metagenome]